MLTKDEIKKLNDERFSIAEQIRNLNKRKDEINNILLGDSAEVVKSRFPNLEYGDKVNVTRKEWVYNGEREITETLFFKSVWQGRYDYEFTPNAMAWKFYKTKKDGNMSHLEVEYHDSTIVNIEKI